MKLNHWSLGQGLEVYLLIQSDLLGFLIFGEIGTFVSTLEKHFVSSRMKSTALEF